MTSPNTNIDDEKVLFILIYLQEGKMGVETAAKSIKALITAAKISELERLVNKEHITDSDGVFVPVKDRIRYLKALKEQK